MSTGAGVETPRAALTAFETGAGRTPCARPAEADGLALCGVSSSSLGDGGGGVMAPGSLDASCVHHVIGHGAGARSCRADVEFVSADAEDVLRLASAARSVSADRSRAVLHRLPEALVDQVCTVAAATAGGPASPADALKAEGLSALSVEGEGSTVLVAAGAEVALARALAEGLRAAGRPCRTVVLRLMQPFPADAVRAAIAGAQQVGVFDEVVRPGRLGGCVELALGGPAAVIGSQLPDWLANVGLPAADVLRWRVVPGGAPGRALLLEAAEGSAPSSRGRLVEGADAAEVRWSASGSDVVAFGAGVGDVDGFDRILFAGSPADLADGARQALTAALERGASVWCASELEPEALSALSSGGNAPEGVRVLASADLAAGGEEEIDFRSKPAGLELPASGDDADLTPWFAFHRGDGFGAPVTSLAAAVIARSVRGAPAWPAVVDGGTVRGWTDAFADLPAGDLSTGGPRLAERLQGQPAGELDLDGALAALADEVAGSDAGRERLEADRSALHDALDGSIEALRPDTALRWTLRAMARSRGAERAALADRVAALTDLLRERLLVEELDSEEGRSAGALSASLGAAGRFFDPSALAPVLPAKGHEALSDEDTAALRSALETLGAWAAEPSVPVVVAPDPVHIDGVRVVVHPDPAGSAVGVFEALSQHAVAVAAAIRDAERLVKGGAGTRVGPGLAELDWQALRADELALLPDVLVLTNGAALRAGGVAGLSALLRSSRPVRVLALDAEDSDEARDLSRHHADLGLLGIAHREAGVLQSSLADPGAFAAGLDALMPAWRPVLVVARSVDPHGPGGAPVDAALARASRAWPELRWDPDAGPSWADRLSLEGNPDVADAWAGCSVACHGAGESLDALCTFADGVAGGAAYGHAFRPLPSDAWSDPALVPLAQWLQDADPGRPRRQLPWIWTVDGATVGRAVVRRGLAFAGRDRARAWKQLQELAGHGDVHAERAATAAREAAEAEAESRVAALEASHAVALETIADDAVNSAMDRLASSLLGFEDLLSAPAASAASAPSAPAATPAPSVEAEAPAAAAEPPPPDDDDEMAEEAYIDVFLCTTCNECTTMNGRMFAYNADKQAEIVDITAGTYEELVKAAEACPSRCIHPGQPRPGDSTANDDLVARAAAFG